LGSRLLEALRAARRGHRFDPRVIRLEDTARDLAALYRALAARNRP
jgi:hypothetical protein